MVQTGLPPSFSRARVVHVTTAHRADDVRIFERECRSLAASGLYDVYLAAAGSIPSVDNLSLIPLTPAPQARLRRFAAAPLKAHAMARTIAADIWHFHDPELLPVAIRLACAGKPVIWDAHEDYVGQLTEPGGKTWVPGTARALVRAGTRSMLELIDKHAAGVVAATPTIGSRYANQRVVVVGNEARLDLFEHCLPDFTSRRVLFTGSPSPEHLFEEVVYAVAEVPGACLAVAGREPDPAIWAKAEACLGERVTHLGWLDRQGIVDAISSSAVGLATYADRSTNAENSPNKLFEFGAAGLPVVATPTNSNKRYVTANGTGVVAEGFSSNDLAVAISRALSSPAAWEAASRAGRAWAARDGSWSDSEARLLNLYSDILGWQRL
jgi:glycosyltransferase involved in cell wall biosynthesis